METELERITRQVREGTAAVVSQRLAAREFRAQGKAAETAKAEAGLTRLELALSLDQMSLKRLLRERAAVINAMSRTTYRIDLHDEKGALFERRWFTLRSDNEALELAAKALHPHVIMVWDGLRLVGALHQSD